MANGLLSPAHKFTQSPEQPVRSSNDRLSGDSHLTGKCRDPDPLIGSGITSRQLAADWMKDWTALLCNEDINYLPSSVKLLGTEDLEMPCAFPFACAANPTVSPSSSSSSKVLLSIEAQLAEHKALAASLIAAQPSENPVAKILVPLKVAPFRFCCFGDCELLEDAVLDALPAVSASLLWGFNQQIVSTIEQHGNETVHVFQFSDTLWTLLERFHSVLFSCMINYLKFCAYLHGPPGVVDKLPANPISKPRTVAEKQIMEYILTFQFETAMDRIDRHYAAKYVPVPVSTTDELFQALYPCKRARLYLDRCRADVCKVNSHFPVEKLLGYLLQYSPTLPATWSDLAIGMAGMYGTTLGVATESTMERVAVGTEALRNVKLVINGEGEYGVDSNALWTKATRPLF